ncbi:MAG: 50S ribosomal protein L28 [Nitrospirae bacterium]|nr:MAG: 50S ribosomal protein L28 [Nitrospirota bacterium]
MAFSCDLCGKKHQSGHNVSHANNKTKRIFAPNLQRVKAVVEGATKHIRVCTRCLRTGLVKKAV